MQVIHHSNYLKWMEEARINFLDSAGISYKKMEDDKITILLTIFLSLHKLF